ncbi:MAG: glutamate formimidoyltransferase [Anaerolineae bacterium]
MHKIVECVPNFSNGRDPHIYNGIAEAIRSVRGVRVLDVSADPDHNRTVITLVGNPTAVEEAAFRGIQFAAQHINLDEHEGEHPRIGATDVCPFIPVKGVTLADCVAIANRLGQRVGDELGIAVYLYGDAATRPERKKLSAIRKGQYEKWKVEIGVNPDRQPDFGPDKPQPWGATVIGVRPFLIAYNIYLNSDNDAIADQIARHIRFIGGGLRFVQAKGFLVDGQAQVSMNLTNFEKTPIFRVQEMVRREAARYGLSITKAELVGLIPQKALLDAARWYLQLDDLEEDQVLELRLQGDDAKDITPEAFLAATADATPTPGGGSVAALAGALAAALAQMVAGLTVDRRKYADVAAEARAVLDQAQALRRQLTAAIAEDALAFEQVMAAWRSQSPDKESAVEKATIGAGEVPLKVARLSRDAAHLGTTIAEIGNANAVTDAAAAVLMAHAAVQTAVLNVKINAVSLQDKTLAQKWAKEGDDLAAETAVLAQNIQTIAARRGGF